MSKAKNILKYWWWQWCLNFDSPKELLSPKFWARTYRSRIMIKMRIHKHYKAHIRGPIVMAQVCKVKGHLPYQTADWGYHGIKCSRCSKWMEFHSHQNK